MAASGLTVNVDFSRDETGPLGGAARVLYSGTAVAPDPGTVWNDYSIAMLGAGSTVPAPYQIDNLVDSIGAATGIDLEMTSGWYRAFNSTIVANNLQKEWVFASSPSTGTATLKGLEPSAAYDLYLITGGARKTDFRVGAPTKTATSAYTANPANWVAGKEYVIFPSVTADANGRIAINVSAGAGETAGEWAGMQIVKVAPATAANFLYAASATSSVADFSSSYQPSNLMNNGFTSPSDTIDTTVPYPAAENNYASASGITDDFTLTFEFSGPATIAGMHVWNYIYRTSGGTGAADAGVNGYTLTFYDGPGATGSTIGSEFSGSLAQALSNAPNPAQRIHFPASYQGVRSVAMHVISNHGGSFTGMSELAFDGIAGTTASSISTFTASAPFVQKPASATLAWNIAGQIDTLQLQPSTGAPIDVKGATSSNGSGSYPVSPIGDRTYTLTLNGTTAKVVSVVGLPTKDKLHIYLLIGQSNMQGEGKPYDDALDAPDPRVIKFGSRAGLETTFATGGHRLTNLAWAAGSDIGMGVEFGKTLLADESDPEVVVCLINHAVGGTAIQWWEPGVTNTVYKNPSTGEYYTLYDEALQRVHDASRFGVIKGVLWHQGEYNSNAANETAHGVYPAGDPEGYALRLRTLVDNLRRDLDRPGLPFICGKLVPDFVSPQLQFRATVEAALADLPNQRSNTFCVDNNGLSGNAGADGIHFNAPSQRVLGRRYAAAILDLHSNPFRFYLGGYLTPSELANPLLNQPDGDNDRDGYTNFLESAFLTNPAKAESAPPYSGGSVTVPGQGEFPIIRFRKRFDPEAPRYQVDVSSDLAQWNSNLDGQVVTQIVGAPLDNGDGTSSVTVRALTEISPANPKQFLRLRVTGP